MRRRIVPLLVGAVAALALAAPPAAASAASGPVTVQKRSSASQRPGPAILYEKAPDAPQLQNAPGSAWKAQPLLVSGASAYAKGEFLYQDYLFDDRGPGSLATYPTGPAYAKDNADLVEFRMRTSGSALLIRLTYNAMIDPALVGSTIAFGYSDTPRPLPFGAGAKAPAVVFATVHGSTVDVTDAATGRAVPRTDASATVDRTRRQVQVRLPGAALATSKLATLRVASASGVWDPAENRYAQPLAGAPDATHPGLNGGTGSALLNAAFRYDESGEWSDADQSKALTAGDLSAFSASVDLRKLRTGASDALRGTEQGAPTSGTVDRIFPSRFEDAQGRGPQPSTSYCDEPCPRVPDYASRLQPYSLTVPDRPAPASGYGMTLNLHYCGGNHNDGPPDADALANRGTGSLVLTPLGRGPCFWYWSEAGADAFEAWADAGRHYRLDPTFTAISGWSMGGYGTYKLVAQFPDLFAKALPDIGCVSAETGWPGRPKPSISGPGAEILPLAESFRNVPILSANANADTLCVTSSQLQLRDRLLDLGYRVDWREYTGGHGPYYPTAEESAAFLGTAKVDPDPSHVSYVLNDAMIEPDFGLDSDHAYWVSGLTLRDTAVDDGHGRVEAVSSGFGRADPEPAAQRTTSGTSNGVPYTGTVQEWQPAKAAPKRDVLTLKLTNIRAVTIDVRRARLTCGAKVDVDSDGPVAVTLAGCR